MWIKVDASGTFFPKLFSFVYSVLNFVFLTTSLSTASLNFIKSTGTVFNLATPKSSTFVFKLFKVVEISTILLMSRLWTSAVKAIQSF